MGKPKRSVPKPALTPEAREQRLIGLAMDQAERDLMEGKASSQVVTHFLKLGTTRAECELEELRSKNALLKAKTSQIEEAQRVGELIEDALRAFRGYSGEEIDDESEELYGTMSDSYFS